MKYVVGVLAFLVSFSVLADSRINLIRQQCHFPKDNGNTNFEDKMFCEGRILQAPNGAAVAGYAIVKTKVPEDFVPTNVTTFSTGANGPCRLYYDENTSAAVDEWRVRIRGNCKEQANGKLSCTATHEIICGNGNDGYVE